MIEIVLKNRCPENLHLSASRADPTSKKIIYCRIRLLLCLLLLLSGVFLSGCATQPGPMVSTYELDAAGSPPPLVNQILVNFVDTHKDTPKPVGQPGSNYRIRGKREVWNASPEVRQIKSEVEHDYNLHSIDEWPIKLLGLHCVVYEVPKDYSIDSVLKKMAGDTRIESAQRMQKFGSLAQKYNDPYLKLQHAAQSMEIVAAHRLARGRGIKVAIIDTGIDVNHPEIRGRITHKRNFVNHDSEAFSGDIHGTAIAGIIASMADNKVGIIGVAPEVEIYALKACWPKNPGDVSAICSSFTLALAITFAIEQGVDILNLSLNGPSDPLLARLINLSLKKGMVVVAATPDEGPTGFPASLDHVIAVDTNIEHLYESNINLVSAPGGGILTTIPYGSYDFLTGTSLAAAHVSGVVALLLERNPELSFEEILRLLRAPGYNNSNASASPSVSAYAALEELTGELRSHRELASN